MAGEHAVLVLDGATLQVTHDGQVASVDEPAVVIVPPGSSSLRITSAGTVIRVIAATTAPEVAMRCANKSEYEVDDTNVTGLRAVARPSGWAPHSCVPDRRAPDRRGTAGAHLPVLDRDGQRAAGIRRSARDPSKLSPHHHDDFEQVSLQAVGDYVHHMRVPWTPDSTTWRDDEHSACQAPSVVVIPPPLVHTSQAVGAMRHWL